LHVFSQLCSGSSEADSESSAEKCRKRRLSRQNSNYDRFGAVESMVAENQARIALRRSNSETSLMPVNPIIYSPGFDTSRTSRRQSLLNFSNRASDSDDLRETLKKDFDDNAGKSAISDAKIHFNPFETEYVTSFASSGDRQK
jgi:hypothetical protein